MTAYWPFVQWGLDIMGPFPMALRQLKFLVVDIDYFTKWVEAEPLATITEKASAPLYGETSSADTGYRGSLSPTMENSSTITRSGTSAQS